MAVPPSSDEKTCPRCAESVKADALVCRFCGYEFAANEKQAPALSRKRGGKVVAGCLIIVLGFIGIATCTTKMIEPGSKLASSPFGVDTQMQSIRDKVAEDAVAQYNIAAQSGTYLDRCSQAGMVAAAYLQAQDQTGYDRWKSTEAADCKRAGARR